MVGVEDGWDSEFVWDRTWMELWAGFCLYCTPFFTACALYIPVYSPAFCALPHPFPTCYPFIGGGLLGVGRWMRWWLSHSHTLPDAFPQLPSHPTSLFTNAGFCYIYSHGTGQDREVGRWMEFAAACLPRCVVGQCPVLPYTPPAACYPTVLFSWSK